MKFLDKIKQVLGAVTPTAWSAITVLYGKNTSGETVETVKPVIGDFGATTADIPDSNDKRYQTENQKTFNDATSSIQTQLNGKQPTGSYEVTTNKSGDFATDGGSTTKYPTMKASKDYMDSLVVGLIDDRGSYDASGNTYPTTGGSGTAGAIMKGDLWFISVAGTLAGELRAVGTSIRALTNSPGQTNTNWSIINAGLGFTPENVANKETTTLDNSTTKYPSNKIVKDVTDLLAPKANPTFTGIVQGITSQMTGANPNHGVVARPVGATNPLPTTLTTTTFTAAFGTYNMEYYFQGTYVLVNTNKSTVLSPGTAGEYWIYLNAATGNLLNFTSFQGVAYENNVLIATVIWNGTDYGLVNDERHSYLRDTRWHSWAHKTIGVRYENGCTLTHNGGTGNAATFSLITGAIWDEDINFIIPSSSVFPTANAGRIFYQTSVNTYSFLNATSTAPFYRGANARPNYVRTDTYATVQMTSAVNRYINVFVYLTTDLHTPLYFFTESVSAVIAGTNGHTSIANARAIPFPNLSSLGLSSEMKAIYRLIIRADGQVQAIDLNLDDYRNVSSIPQAAGNNVPNAIQIPFAPTATILSSNVQLAIEEVDTNMRTNYAALAGALFTGVIGLPKDTRNGLSAIYADATGDKFGLEQVSGAQTGTVAATRLFTSNAGSSTLAIGKYTTATAFTSWLSFASTGVATFTSFPITPSSAPTTDYQVANKKYVDDAVAGGGSVKEFITVELNNSTSVNKDYAVTGTEQALSLYLVSKSAGFSLASNQITTPNKTASYNVYMSISCQASSTSRSHGFIMKISGVDIMRIAGISSAGTSNLPGTINGKKARVQFTSGQVIDATVYSPAGQSFTLSILPTNWTVQIMIEEV